MALMDDLPAEVVHQIFKHFNFHDATALRLLGKRYADIGAEYLVTRVRFFTEQGSLQRLRNFAKHPGMCRQIKTIVYEGNLLGLRCYHAYRDHFREDHHAGTGGFPQQPPDGASQRTLRLYKRNYEKWEEGIQQDFNEYHAAYEAQQGVLYSRTFEKTLSSTAMFPNLEHIHLTTASRCGHNLSQRYSDTYKLSCAMPLEMCSAESTYQLQSLIFPKGKPLLNLKSLHVHALSPKAFMSKAFKAGAVDVFKSLKSVHLVFRLESEDRYGVHSGGVGAAYRDLANGNLRSSLTAANDLESLLINFDDLGYFGPAVDVNTILGDAVWPKLRFLDLDCMKATKGFVETLQRQPSLKVLALSFMFLDGLDWVTTIKTMKFKLSLDTFATRGLLEDTNNLYNTFHIDGLIYCDDHIEISMSDMLDDFVTSDIWDVDEDFNPLTDIDWQDPDELYEQYGLPEDSEDSDIDMSDGSDMSDSSTNDSADHMDVD